MEKIPTLKTKRLDSKELIHTLQNGKTGNKNDSLYGEILGETSLQLGTYYSNSSRKSDLEKAKRLLLQSKWYAPLTVASAIPAMGLSKAAAMVLLSAGVAFACSPAFGIAKYIITILSKKQTATPSKDELGAAP